jgi:hypothetical protein
MQPDLKELLRWDAGRRTDRPLLRPPNVDQLRNEPCRASVSQQLKACCDTIAARGLLYRWRRFTGEVRLVVWSKSERQFLNFDPDLFAHFLGSNFDLIDAKTNVHYGLPALSVSTTIWEALAKMSG